MAPIETVKTGDQVLSWNQISHRLEYKAVLRAFAHVAAETVAISIAGESKPIVVTLGHPFYVRRARDDASGEDDGNWLYSGKLRVGNEVRRPNGRWVRIVGLVHQFRPVWVYNFEVKDNHDYFVTENGVLVHNQSAITMDDAVGQAVNHAGPNGELGVTRGKNGNFQFQSREIDAQGNLTVRNGRLDVNPANAHVIRNGPHLNLEVRVNGVQVGVDPHMPIIPSTIHPGDIP